MGKGSKRSGKGERKGSERRENSHHVCGRRQQSRRRSSATAAGSPLVSEAAICNFFIPGLGQLVQGRILPALFFFIGMAISWVLVWILIGWILVPIVYLWAIIDAARYKGGN